MNSRVAKTPVQSHSNNVLNLNPSQTTPAQNR
uniref:Uncharacterized protein n=1 Tax=Anguilla anguilla TaxID=7936 RepID=A0A0E9U8R3_ANGAN